MKRNTKRTELRPVVINKTFSDVAVVTTLENNKEIGARSSGDGMESYRPCNQNQGETFSGKISPTSEIPVNTKRREPKFVPYEPYKAAVNPILSNNETGKMRRSKPQHSLSETHIPFPLVNNSVNVRPLVRVLREIPRESSKSPTAPSDEQWEEERIKYEEEIAKLKLEKREMENQFKVQTQVNAELKKLLVASMGEDMQSRVQFLSEDKAQLAHDIAHYTKMLQEEHEEIERLAIQSDIWRSKFLACSLMVDELAGWKALLSRKYEESKEAIQWMLDERNEIKQSCMNTQRFLRHLQRVFDPMSCPLPKSRINNMLSVSQGNCVLADALHYRLLGATKYNGTPEPPVNFEGLTPAEDMALRVLSTKEVTTPSESRHHHICRYQAGRPDLSLHACRHCSGDVDVV